MTREEGENWLINITADIGKAEHQGLWHYEQTLLKKAVVDAVKNAVVLVAWDDEADEYDVADIAIKATKRSVIESIEELPSAQQNRLERAVTGKSPEEIYNFLYWLMFDYARAYTDSRAAVIAWLKGE